MGNPKSSNQQGQFSYGPSQFDLQAILNALGGDQQAITNRANQLGVGNLGGGTQSTMLQQDLAQAGLAAQAGIGQEQLTSVGNAATNPALQSPSSVPGQALSTLGTLGSDVTQIASNLGKAAGTTAANKT